MAKILSAEDISTMLDTVNSISECTENAASACETVVNSFTNEAIVQSFYASGAYGEKEQTSIEQILSAVKKYYGVINAEGGLIAQTKTFLNTQLSLLETGQVGYGQTEGQPSVGSSPSGGYYGGGGGGNSPGSSSGNGGY